MQKDKTSKRNKYLLNTLIFVQTAVAQKGWVTLKFRRAVCDRPWRNTKIQIFVEFFHYKNRDT